MGLTIYERKKMSQAKEFGSLPVRTMVPRRSQTAATGELAGAETGAPSLAALPLRQGFGATRPAFIKRPMNLKKLNQIKPD